jgi:glycosyltransferase involved in cell wall biosynthesis
MKRHLVFSTISLNQMAGGLEKNIILLANYFADNNYDVTLITFDLHNAESFYPIHKRVKWHRIGCSPVHSSISFSNRLELMKKIRGHIRRMNFPIIVCFHHGILSRFFFSTLFLEKKIICSERNSLSLYDYIRQPKWNMNFLFLSFVDWITVQFPEYVHDYPFWVRRKIIVLPNPVLPTTGAAKPNVSYYDDRFILLAVGRLCAQKQQHILIESFIESALNNPSWDLYIIGDGDRRNDLQKQIDASGLQKRIFLLGKRDNVSDWYVKANLFCLPSQWEGFPNVLAEAMVHGLPCIGFSECAGVRELMEDGVTGRLVGDADSVSALKAALTELMRDEVKRVQFGNAACQAMLDYEPKQIFSRWERLLIEPRST